MAVAIVAALYAAVGLGRLAFHDWDPTVFVDAGAYFYDQSRAPQVLRVRTKLGYDGQFYYHFALHPLTRERTGYGMKVDAPPYRSQRILYSVLACILALHQTRWVPWSLIAVNFVAICGLAWSAAAFARRFGAHPLYGLTIPLMPAILFGFARDLTDPLALALVVFALLLFESHRTVAAAAVLTLAVLARETSMVLAGALFVLAVWRAMRRQAAWRDAAVLALPLVAYLALQLWLTVRWNEIPLSNGWENVARVPLWPFISFTAWAFDVSAISSVGSLLYHLMHAIEMVLLITITGLAAIVFTRAKVTSSFKLGWVGYVGLAALYSRHIWVDDWACMRACADLLAMGYLMILGGRDERLARIPWLITLVLWLPIALRVTIIQ